MDIQGLVAQRCLGDDLSGTLMERRYIRAEPKTQIRTKGTAEFLNQAKGGGGYDLSGIVVNLLRLLISRLIGKSETYTV